MQQAKIMIVEDEGLIAEDLAMSLQKLGYQTTPIVDSVEQALERIPKDLPDLLLMDITLGEGELDGIEGARTVRTRFDLPVIFLTAHSDSQTLDRAKQTEPFGYLVKPVRKANLMATIETGLHKYRIDKQLRERESWLTTILESLPNPTILTDLKGTICFANLPTSKLLNSDPTVLIGQSFRAVVPLFYPETCTAAEDLVEAVILLRRTLRFPHGLVLKNAFSDTPVEGEVAPTFSGEKITGAIITLRNSADHEKASLQRYQEKTMAALGRMAAGIAAQLRSVPKQIYYAGQYDSEQISDPEFESGTKDLLEAAAHCSDILKQLQALSATRNRQPEVFNLNTNVRRVIEQVETRLPATVRIEAYLADTLFDVRATPGELDQVLLILLARAIGSIPNAGTIVVSTSTYERHCIHGTWETMEQFVRLTINDSGIEMPRESQELIFEPFSVSNGGGMVELGLFIAHAIIKDTGGEITLKSGERGGTSFEILLPREELRQREHPVAGSHKCILLVYHDQTTRTLLHNHLEKHGYQVLPAENAAEAIMIEESYEDAVDMLILAGADPAFVSNIRRRRPLLKCLFLSRNAREDSNALGTLPQDCVLSGPFSITDVMERVEQLMTTMRIDSNACPMT